MSSRRGYRRRDYVPRNYLSKASKYQFVPFSIQFNWGVAENKPNAPGRVNILVPPSTVSGIRKVKNFNINFVTNSSRPLLFACVYAPEGANVENLKPNIVGLNTSSGVTFTEMFAANQWVIGCGSIANGAINVWKTRMSRNLNNGDSVYLFVWQLVYDEADIDANVDVNATGNYAIRYN